MGQMRSESTEYTDLSLNQDNPVKALDMEVDLTILKTGRDDLSRMDAGFYISDKQYEEKFDQKYPFSYNESRTHHKTIEVCKKILEKRELLNAGQAKDEPVSECVVLCKRSGPNMFDITKGIAKVAGDFSPDMDNQFIVSRSMKMIFIIT